MTPQVWAGPEPHLGLLLQGPVGGRYLVLTMAGNWGWGGSQLESTGLLSCGAPGSP